MLRIVQLFSFFHIVHKHQRIVLMSRGVGGRAGIFGGTILHCVFQGGMLPVRDAF